MRALLWLIGIFALAVGLAALARFSEGLVLITLPPWQIDMSFNLFVLLLIGGFLLVYVLYRLLSGLYRFPGSWGQWRLSRRKTKAGRALREEVQTVLEGHYSQTLKLASTAYADQEDAPMAALLAAYAAHELDDDKRFRSWMDKAAKQGKAFEPARRMLTAELAIRDDRPDEAHAELEQLRAVGFHYLAIDRLALRVAKARKQWDEVLRLARYLRSQKALSQKMAARMLHRAHIELLEAVQDDSEALVACWKGIPAEEQRDRWLLVRALPLLAAKKQGAVARKVLENALDEEWDGTLARLYASCGQTEQEALTCLNRAEKWLERHPDDAGLLYSLGQLSTTAQLWGKAQGYLEASLNRQKAVDTYLAFAHMHEQMGQDEEAQRGYQAAALLIR